jgi:hypothetical protein
MSVYPEGAESSMPPPGEATDTTNNGHISFFEGTDETMMTVFPPDLSSGILPWFASEMAILCNVT